MTERLRIVEVNAFHYPYRGGIENRVHNIGKRLAEKHDVIVLTSQLPDTDPRETIDGYEVLRLPSKFIGRYNPPYVSTSGLMEALKALDPDIVDFHYRWAPTYNKLARGYPGKKVFTFHNTFGEGVGITRLPSMVNDQMWKRHLKRFGKVVCISEFIRTDLIRRGLDPLKLVTVPNGVDMPDVRADIEEKDFILFVGRLVATKGLPYLIRAMARIDSKLVICGAGPEERHLRKLASKLGLDRKVEFAGKVSEERKSELLASCKIFVMPSLYESYGIAVAEAMSFGRPIVATSVGGLPEVVKDAGLISAAKDPSDLACKINDLLLDDGRRAIMGARARTYSLKYDWDSIASKMESLYVQSIYNGHGDH
ncbi:MAG: glycosyltransferase family 4 protein [Euryarchaeota archaeon]|nr:glycosyltransferase family 4 protein [Euryarchaeota archaeon]